MSRPLIEYARAGDRLEGIRVFDCHAHVGDFAPVLSPSLERQVREMDRIGIEWAAVSSVEAIFGDIPRGNDDVAAAAARYPGRFIGYCHVSAQYPDLMLAELERCFRNPVFRAVKVYQVGTNYDDPAFDAVWQFARARRVPVLAHTWAGNVTGLDKAAARFPEVPFLAGHSGSGFVYQPYIDMARRLPNFYLDLTYSREHTNVIERMVQEAGAGRVVWGTDAPTFSMSQQIGKVLFAQIPDEAKKKILFENAASLFRLV